MVSTYLYLARSAPSTTTAAGWDTQAPTSALRPHTRRPPRAKTENGSPTTCSPDRHVPTRAQVSSPTATTITDIHASLPAVSDRSGAGNTMHIHTSSHHSDRELCFTLIGLFFSISYNLNFMISCTYDLHNASPSRPQHPACPGRSTLQLLASCQ